MRPLVLLRPLFSRLTRSALVTSMLVLSIAEMKPAAWAQNPITVSPTSLSFSSTPVAQTSAAKAVTITNTGSSTQAVVITPSGDYTESDNCAGSIGAGGSCTMNVVFAPTIAGTISGAVSIRDNSGNLLAFVGATGKAVAPVTTAPTSLSFGSIPIGTLSTAKTFKITSGISQVVTITSITGSPDYVINTGTCLTSTLSKGQSCTVSVQVQPTQATDNGAIVITDNATGGLPLVVALSTSGTGTNSAPLTLSKTSLTFKSYTGGQSAAQAVTVTNSSVGAVTMGAITASSQYSETNNCPASGSSLAAGASCTVNITFAPTFVGKIGGAVAVAYTGNDSPQLVVVSGTSSDILSATAKVAFGNQNIGTTSTAHAVKITNDNTVSAETINSISTSGDFPIQAQGTNCPLSGGSLGAGKSCTVEVLFAPTVSGAIVGAVTVTDAASPNPLLVALSGTGVNTASATLTPSSAHQGSSETIVITGTGTTFGPSTTVNFGADITTGTVTVNGPTSASVPITIDNVAATGSRTVTITTGTQAVSATFTVVAGVPAVTTINPNTIQPTQTENVAIAGAFTSWVQGTTKANFGAGITVNSLTVNSGTSLTANLTTSGAATGFRTVQIQTGAQTLTVNNGIDVQTCTATAPTMVSISPASNAYNVPLNAIVQALFSVPMNRSTFSLGTGGTTTIFFRDGVTGVEVPGAVTLDASGTIATITPSQALYAGRTYYIYFSYANYVQDTCGNNLSPVQFSFTTAFGNSLTGPTLTGTNPVNGDSNVPISSYPYNVGTTVVLQFNDQLDPVTAQTGFSMTTGGNTVPGTFSYSTDDKTVTFTPATALTASTTYTVAYTAQITDTVGNVLTNPGSFTFSTGTAGDTAYPQVTLVDPPNGAFNVGLNVAPRLTFSQPVDGLSIPGALGVYYQNGNLIIPATVTVAANRLSATITPTSLLLPGTEYGLYLCGYTSIAGTNGNCSYTVFYTGTGADTTHATVTSISPANGQTGVPLNVQITALMSKSIDPTSVNNGSITVTPSGGSAIAGTVTLGGDGAIITFVPTASLTASKVYNVSVGGFNDIDGNSVTTFTSSFTTGTSSYGGGTFLVNATSPGNGATGVPVNSPITFTMTNLINAASVNPNTVFVYDTVTGAYVAGSYNVSGTAVTFTPLTPYPGNTLMYFGLCSLTDLAGNSDCQYWYTFTTANTIDSTPPTVTISPANGTTNVGLNSQVVLTFSKSINPATVNTNSLALFSGDVSISYGYTISRDNRTIVINPSGSAWAPGATIAIELTNAIQDMSGNALANTSSQFTLTTALSTSAPYVIAMRPGNGATNVPANTPITLFTSMPMNASTVAGAFNVTDNGAVVNGTVQLFSSGQAIQFTPSNSFNAGDLIQVFLSSAAQSSSGVPLSNFGGQFTVAGSLMNTAAQVVTMNPFSNAANVPLNTVIQVEYNQPIQASSVTCNGNAGSVRLYEYVTGNALMPNCSVSGGVITITPTANLTAGSQYQVYVDYASNVTNIDGLAVQAFAYNFTAGTAKDTAAPTIVSQAPSNNATNIGTNAQVSLNFNKAINPVSVTGSTVQLAGGSVTETPSSIAFTPDYTRVVIIPQAPLPPSTAMTMTVNGVLSQAGVSAAKTTTTFTTAAQPDFSAPYVVSSSVQSGQTNVPVNSVFTMTFNKPMDIGSYNSQDVNLYTYAGGIGVVPATVTWSADQTTVFITPASALYVGTQYYLESYYLNDLSGNPQINFFAGFTTSFAPNTNPPTVINTNPENGTTQVPDNAAVEILFSEPIQPTSIGQVTLTTGANAVPVVPSFSNANRLLTLTPTITLLAPNTAYTITITGVKDTAGNTMAGTVTETFTTGPSFDLMRPSVTFFDPPNGAMGVGTNVLPRVQFSKRLNPITVVTSSNEGYFNNGSVEMYNAATGQWVPLTVAMDSTRTIATLTPNTALNPNTQFVFYIGCSQGYFDVAGNYGSCITSQFTTGPAADTTHATVSTITPSNGQTGVPLNVQIVALMGDAIDPTTVSNSSITVTPQGGSAIAGTVTLGSDGATLTFAPSANLAASQLYNVSVSGPKDIEGNTITAFSSSFTTGTTSYGSGSFTVNSTSPVSGATGVSVTSPITFTMSNLVNAASVNPNTVFVYDTVSGSYVAGTYAVVGNAVTFTPLSPYPGNTLMYFGLCNLTDQAGNSDCQYWYQFTTANTLDHTAPTVTITPSNGSTNLGLNTQAVLTFSKSINPATVNNSSVNLFNGDVPLNPSIAISRDNRTVVLSYNPLPANSTMTVVASHLITDLSGNALADTSSQFTTMSGASLATPYVVSMRPGNGATNVPANTVITLFTSAPMNAGSLSGAVHVSQNGILVAGTVAVGSNGQSVEFTPTSNLTAGTATQVFLDSTAQDIYGNYLSYFAGSFTTAGALSNTAAQVVAVNPFPNATNVPLNTIIQVEYNQPILASSVNCNGNAGSVRLYEYATGNALVPNCSVSGGVITITPTANLLSGSQYQVYVDYASNVTNTDGVAVQAFAFNFTAGSAKDTVAPVINYVAPANAATNIGTNAAVTVTFNKAINPVSVTGTTIQLTGGSITEVPSSISFSSDFTRATIIPQAPLPSSTLMTIAISGVTSQAGVAVANKSTQFTTMAGADFNGPFVINPSVQSGQTVGTNAAFAMQFNKPLDPGSVNVAGSQYVYIYDYNLAAYVSLNITFSADLTTVFLKPTSALGASHSLQMCSYYMTDLSGNPQQNFCLSFNTASGSMTTGPSVVQVNPPSAMTGVPVNAPVQILFSEPIDSASLAGVTLKQGGSVVPTSVSLFDGDQGVQLLPLAPLAASTTYTINVTGVLDITGNAQASFAAQSFTTGTVFDLVVPALVSTNPANGATNVPVTTTVQVVFSAPMDPASFDPNTSLVLYNTATSSVVPATISFSSNYTTATLTPKANLTGGGVTYYVYIGDYSQNLFDVGGNRFGGTTIVFTTH